MDPQLKTEKFDEIGPSWRPKSIQEGGKSMSKTKSKTSVLKSHAGGRGLPNGPGWGPSLNNPQGTTLRGDL